MAVRVASSRSRHLPDSRVGAELPGMAFQSQQRQAPDPALGPGVETADPAGRPRAGFHAGLYPPRPGKERGEEFQVRAPSSELIASRQDVGHRRRGQAAAQWLKE